MPDTIFGVVVSVWVRLPGSMRSGLYPTATSRPTVSPDRRSRIGTNSSSVVPGYVVDSRTTSEPGDTSGPMA